MGNYSTVRIDLESKRKLEEIRDQIGVGIDIEISLATALRLVINDAYEMQVVNPRRMFEDLTNKANAKEEGNENG